MRGRRAIGRGRMGMVATIADVEVNKEGVVAEETSMMMAGCVVGGGDESSRRRRIRDTRTT